MSATRKGKKNHINMHFGCGRIGGATDRVQYLQAQLFPVCTITAKGNQNIL